MRFRRQNLMELLGANQVFELEGLLVTAIRLGSEEFLGARPVLTRPIFRHERHLLLVGNTATMPDPRFAGAK